MPKGRRGSVGGKASRGPSRSFSSHRPHHRPHSMFHPRRTWRHHGGPWYRPSTYHGNGGAAVIGFVAFFIFLLIVLPLFLSFLAIGSFFSLGPTSPVDNGDFNYNEPPMSAVVPIKEMRSETKSVHESSVTLAPEEYYYAVFEDLAATPITVEYRLAQPHNVTILVLTESQYYNWANYQSYDALHEEITSNATVALTIQGKLDTTNYVVLYNDQNLNDGEDIVISAIDMEAMVQKWTVVGYTTVWYSETFAENPIVTEQAGTPLPLAFPIIGLAIIFFVIVGIVVVAHNKNRNNGRSSPSRIQRDAVVQVPSSSVPSATLPSAQLSLTCPECKEPVESDDKFCMNCGALLPTKTGQDGQSGKQINRSKAFSSMPSATRPSKHGSLTCPKCKEPVESGDQFCMNCGTLLS